MFDQANSCTAHHYYSPLQQWHEQQRLQHLQQLLRLQPHGATGGAGCWQSRPSIVVPTVPTVGPLAVPSLRCGTLVEAPSPWSSEASSCREADARVWDRVDALTDELTDLAARLQAVVDAPIFPLAASDDQTDDGHSRQLPVGQTSANVVLKTSSNCPDGAETPPPGFENVSPTLSRRVSFLSHATPKKRERQINRRMERIKSQCLWSTPDETIIVFDFDDTLFPTTWICDDMALESVDDPLGIDCIRVVLERCALSAITVLELAVLLSEHVVIVTLARRGWLEKMVSRYTPDLEGKFDELGISVVYAREFLDVEGSDDRWTRAKADAIAQECEKLYSKYQGQSWKNVIVVGDSDFEIEGTEMTVRRWTYENRRSWQQLPRLKTVKLVDSPTCAELEQELKILEVFLECVQQHDLCACIDFGQIRDHLSLDSAQELLVSSRSESCEPPSEAIIESRLWKLCHDSDPCDPDRWRPRRVWLSQTGQLWYESLKEVKPSLLFEGCTINELDISCLGDFRLRASSSSGGQTPTFSKSSIQIAGKPLYAIQLKHRDNTKSGLTMVLAAESWDLRHRWIFSCVSHQKRSRRPSCDDSSGVDSSNSLNTLIDMRRNSDGLSSTGSVEWSSLSPCRRNSLDLSSLCFDRRGSSGSLIFSPTVSLRLQTVQEAPDAAG